MSSDSIRVAMCRLFAGILILAVSGVPVTALAGGGATFTQEHYRWRSDDGSESAASWLAGADTPVTNITRHSNIRLRFSLRSTAGYDVAPLTTLQYSTATNGPWLDVSSVTNGTAPFQMATSVHFANGESTTPLLPGTGIFLAGRMVEYPSNAAEEVTFATNNYSNFEYDFHATAKAYGGSNYYFQLSGAAPAACVVQLTMAPGGANEGARVVSGLSALWPAGVASSYRILSSGSEPVTYAAANLPAGLFLDGDTIRGTATELGAFNVGLTVSNAWGTDSKTLVLEVGNVPPVANSSGPFTASSATQIRLNLYATDQNPGQTLAYELVSEAAAHGDVRVFDEYAIYVSDAGYVGPASFTWRCSDGFTNSNVATLSLDVQPAVPEPAGQTVCVARNTTNDIAPKYSGGGGYTCVVATVAGPAHGTVTATNGIFRYAPAANYSGPDAFTWRMLYGTSAPTSVSATVTCTISVKESASTDWPQWRGNEYRDAATAVPLASSLYLKWRRDFRPAQPVNWAHSGSNFEKGLEPVVAGKRIFVASSRTDSLTAVDTEGGTNLWTFYANGPIRCAPVATSNRVVVVSDDGYAYGLNPTNGTVIWKFQAAPNARKAFGNGRMISVWPVRGGPLLKNGIVYFAAGLWPWEGTFVVALNADTGALVWRNDAVCATPMMQAHDGGAIIGGVSPQGYLVAKAGDTNRFYVPASRYPAMVLQYASGAMDQWDGAYLGADTTRANAFIDSSGLALGSGFPVGVTAGVCSWTEWDAWVLGVSGTVVEMLAADSKLFVVTEAGSLYCFGPTAGTPGTYTNGITPLSAPADFWATNMNQITNGLGSIEGMASVWGISNGRAMEELVRRTSSYSSYFRTVGAGTNTVTNRWFRDKLIAADVHGQQASVIDCDPVSARFPPYIFRLIVVEDPAAAGFNQGTNFVNALFRSLRPYGGTAWLPLSAAEYTSLSNWVTACSLSNCSLARTNGFSVLTRVGKLAGAVEARGSVTATDELAVPPFGVSWYGDLYVGSFGGMGHNPGADICISTGRIISANNVYADVYSGLLSGNSISEFLGISASAGVSEPPNSMFGSFIEPSAVPYQSGYGCGFSSRSYGNLWTYRSSSGAYWDFKKGNRLVNLAGLRFECGGTQHVIPANGMLTIGQQQGCLCAYGNGTSIGLYNEPEAEMWSHWGDRFTSAALVDEPFRRIGYNFGAPGERIAPDDGRWIHQPMKVGPWIGLSARYTPADATPYYHHSAFIQNQATDVWNWVAASGLEGVTNIAVPVDLAGLAPETAAAPSLDGVLSDSCWDGASPVSVSGEALVITTDYARSLKTPRNVIRNFGTVWFRHDATNLYVACKAPCGSASDVWKIHLSDRRQALRFAADTAVTLAITASGARSGTKLLGTGGWNNYATNTWSNSWNAAVQTNGGQFVAEYAIPFASLEASGYSRTQLIVNVDGPGVTLMPDGNLSFVPLYLDALTGLHAPRTYDVRLTFAETQGATNAGDRVFDVKLQGVTVLSDFDIVAAAGGPNRGVARTVSGVQIGQELNITLVPKAGQPLISGVEVIGSYAEPNRLPVTVVVPTGADQTMNEGSSRVFQVDTYHNFTYDPDGGAVSLQFELDGVLKTTATSYNYTGTVGDHKIRLLMTDAEGGQKDYTWNVSVLSTSPAPVITSAAVATGVVGQSFSYTITATGVAPIGYGASGLPAGLSISGAVISGTPSSICTSNATITATNAYGGDTNALVITIVPEVPVITSQPQSTTVMAGEAASFSVTASGAPPLNYQWLTNGATLAGGNGSSCSIPVTVGTDSGRQYRVVVGNAYGAVTSSVATLTVQQPGTNTCRMSVGFSGYTRSEALTNFPVLLVLSNNVAGSGFAYNQLASANGFDLRFKDAAETVELNYEVETWNTNGASYLWVQIPVLTSNTVIKALWGDTLLAARPAASRTNGLTWASSYRGVWHMAAAGTNSQDATTNNHAGTLNNGPVWTNGAVGSSLSFDGVNDTVTLGTELWDADAAGSVSAWVYPRASGGALLAATTQGNDNRLIRFCQSGFIQSFVSGSFNDAVQPVTPLTSNQWHFITWTSTGSSWTFYDNGVQKPVSLAAGGNAGRWFNAVASSGVQTYQMGDLNATYADKLNGVVDELRVESVCRSSNWIWACYQNMASNGAFASFGAATVPAGSDADGDGLPDVWEIQNFGGTNTVNGAATNDWDHDGMSNEAEYLAGTSPTNAGSILRVESALLPAARTNFVISWPSVTGRWYAIRTSTNLIAGFDGVAASNIPATPALNTSTLTVDHVQSRYFKIVLE